MSETMTDDKPREYECRYDVPSCGAGGWLCDRCREDRADDRTRLLAEGLQILENALNPGVSISDFDDHRHIDASGDHTGGPVHPTTPEEDPVDLSRPDPLPPTRAMVPVEALEKVLADWAEDAIGLRDGEVSHVGEETRLEETVRWLQRVVDEHRIDVPAQPPATRWVDAIADGVFEDELGNPVELPLTRRDDGLWVQRIPVAGCRWVPATERVPVGRWAGLLTKNGVYEAAWWDDVHGCFEAAIVGAQYPEAGVWWLDGVPETPAPKEADRD